MNSTSLGRKAEEVAANTLKRQGYKIRVRNWRTRWCEIDLVAQKDKTVYFVEVKYRVSGSQGDPSEYVTTTKLKQMTFAAEFWVSQNDWSGDIQLVVASVIGERFKLQDLIFLD